MSADLGHINLAIVRRPSHPPQWHAHPLASHRQPGIHTATLIRSPARIRSPQSVRQLRTSSSHSPFALGLRQPCACHALPSARISQSCSRPRSPTGCEGMRSPAGCSLYFVMALRYRASPPKSRLRLRRELPLPFAILQWAPLRQSVRRSRAHAVAHDGLHELGHPACESLVGDEFVGKEAASHDGIDVLAHI